MQRILYRNRGKEIMVYSSSLLVLTLIQAGNNNAQRHQADPVYLIAKITAIDVAIHVDA